MDTLEARQLVYQHSNSTIFTKRTAVHFEGRQIDLSFSRFPGRALCSQNDDSPEKHLMCEKIRCAPLIERLVLCLQTSHRPSAANECIAERDLRLQLYHFATFAQQFKSGQFSKGCFYPESFISNWNIPTKNTSTDYNRAEVSIRWKISPAWAYRRTVWWIPGSNPTALTEASEALRISKWLMALSYLAK